MTSSRQPLRAVPSESDSFGSRLRRQRRIDQETQAELGGRFGVRQQTIGAWERGERPQPRFYSELAEYLHMNKEELAFLIDSRTELPASEDAASDVGVDAESNDETMRMLARRFVKDLDNGALPPAKAADIYRNLTEYFRDRATDR